MEFNESVIDFFKNCKLDLIEDDYYNERSEDSITYEAIDTTCLYFGITEDEFYKITEGAKL